MAVLVAHASRKGHFQPLCPYASSSLGVGRISPNLYSQERRALGLPLQSLRIQSNQLYDIQRVNCMVSVG
jgi:hypothetical protein